MNNIVKSTKLASQSGNAAESPCKDCIFWYQCRRGEIDCHLRPQRLIQNMIRA